LVEGGSRRSHVRPPPFNITTLQKCLRLVVIVPPVTRLKVSVEQHFIDGQACYAPSHLPLARVHVVPITTALDYTVDYAAKGLRDGRIDHDDAVIILSRSASELR
jgi:hypothetical protein